MITFWSIIEPLSFKSCCIKSAVKTFQGDNFIIGQGVLDLIEWVYWRHNQHARHILRQKIYVTAEPDTFESALIKTAAKRWELVSDVNCENPEAVDALALQEMREQNAVKGAEDYEKYLGETFGDKISAGKWVAEQVNIIFRCRENGTGEPLHSQPRPIVAALFDENWRLLAAARNTNEVVRTRHAEMNLLHALTLNAFDVSAGMEERSASKGHKELNLIVSTQCCRMCAAAVLAHFKAREDVQKFNVYYLTPEPSLKNVKTALHGHERPLSVQSEQRQTLTEK